MLKYCFTTIFILFSLKAVCQRPIFYNSATDIVNRDTLGSGNFIYFKNTFYNVSGNVGTYSGAGKLYGTGKFVFGDTIYNESGSLFYGDKTSAEIVGNDTVRLLGNADSIYISKLYINQPSGSVFKLGMKITVNSILGFAGANTGNILLNNYDIRLLDDANLVGETNTSRIYGKYGKIWQWFIHNSTLTNFGGLGFGFNTSQALGDCRIERGHAMQAGVSDTGSILRHYNFYGNGASPAITVNGFYFNYLDNENRTLNESRYGIYRGALGLNWRSLRGINNTVANNVILNNLQLSDTTLRFTLSHSECDNPLSTGVLSKEYFLCNGSGLPLQTTLTGVESKWSVSTILGWKILSQNNSISIGSPGIYSLLCIDARGCEGYSVFTVIGKALPVANFSAIPTCTGMSIRFKNNSSIAGIANLYYKWNFGDTRSFADTSNLVNPSYLYTNSNKYLLSTYNATLTVTSEFGCAASYAKSVTGLPYPKSDFTFSNICPDQNALFKNLTTISGGYIISDYTWQFHTGEIIFDNRTVTGPVLSPIRNYTSPGLYAIKLISTSNTCKDTVTKEITVYPKPSVSFSASNVCEDANLQLSNTTSLAGSSLSYVWEFGNGATSTQRLPLYSYGNYGNYTIKLIATSDKNCKDSFSKPITIYDKPNVAFNAPSVCVGTPVDFQSTTTANYGSLLYNWTLGNSSTETATSFTFIYSVAGTYAVKQVATTSYGCSDSIIKPIAIHPKPKASFSLQNTCPNTVISYQNTSGIASGTLSYIWKSNNAIFSNAQNPSEIKSNSGNYSIFLKTISDKGCSDSTFKTLTIYTVPAINLSDSISTCANSYRLDAENIGSTYVWSNFSTSKTIDVANDGNYSVAIQNPQGCVAADTVFVKLFSVVKPRLGLDRAVCGNTVLDAGYPGASILWNNASTSRFQAVSASGTFSVSVTDQNNCSGKDTVSITVNPLPIVALGNDIKICKGLQKTIDAQNGGASYIWSTGAGSQRILPEFSGDFSVKVTNQYSCSASDTINVVLYNLPLAKLPTTITACERTVLDAGNEQSKYTWNTGDTTKAKNVVSSGQYMVTVTNANGCFITSGTFATIHESPSVYLGNDRTICNGENVLLDAYNSGLNYKWQDGSENRTFRAVTAGVYKVTVKNTFDCEASDEIEIRVATPLNINLGTDLTYCPGSVVLLDAGNATAYNWNSSVGQSGNAQTFNAKLPGKYWVEVSGSTGCKERDTISIISSKDTLQGEFIASTKVAVGDTIQFLELSYGQASSFQWYFGDGGRSSEASPSKVYFTPGTYRVTLVVYNQSCNDTLVKYIEVQSTEELRDQQEEGIKDKFSPYIDWTVFSAAPNPTDMLFDINLAFSDSTEVEILIVSTQAQAISIGKFIGKEIKVSYNLGYYPSGVYLVKAIANGKIRTLKVLKL